MMVPESGAPSALTMSAMAYGEVDRLQPTLGRLAMKWDHLGGCRLG